jgi:hypothetical protein
MELTVYDGIGETLNVHQLQTRWDEIHSTSS